VPRGFTLTRRHRARWLVLGASLCVLLVAFLFLSFPFESRPPTRYVGFSVFSPYGPLEREFATDADRRAYLQEQGYLVAQHTSRFHGNLVRVPVDVWSLLAQDLNLDPTLPNKPVYQLDLAVISRALDQIQVFLDAGLAAIKHGKDPAGRPLRWDFWDAFFLGIQKYNLDLSKSPNDKYQPVYVDLLLADSPPTKIIEAPTDKTLQYFRSQTSRQRLWDSYSRLQAQFIRKLIQRYGRGYSRQGIHALIPIAAAIEMFNEPDYIWLPDEAIIEKALNPDAYPCDKYITQLHLSQIPENDLPGKACARQDGFYVQQDLALPHTETPLKDFNWGLKFNKYVASFADLHEHASFAAKDEIGRGNAEMVVVSSAVTHVNLDWLVRMFHANQNTFRYVDKIAIHPYHWPQHDIHDMRFVGQLPAPDWRVVNPRKFASDYLKRFDFIQRLVELVARRDPETSYGLAGKGIWITEFGIPTKTLGKANAGLRNHPRMFIYDRATPVPDGIRAIVWEDKWKTFLDQVTVDYLRRNRVEAFLLFTLRESLHYEAHDDSHSNFALYRADWSCRLDPNVLQRLTSLFLSFRDGQSRKSLQNQPVPANSKDICP